MRPGMNLKSDAPAPDVTIAHIRDPFPEIRGSSVGFILEGTIERTVRLATQLHYQRDPRWWIKFDAGINFVENNDNVEGASETKFIGMFEVGARFSLNRPFSLAGL